MSKIKTIDMKKLINGLGINKGDIVVVDNICLICNDKYDLVRSEVLSETAQAALKPTKEIKKYKGCKPVAVGK